ncbi:unnamed protein product [Rhizoctonia solani]|uniref:Uncharacterized protein n=1 Tax=Rhizoctonia solani TaxID=456999 RepID=A0A8H2Y1W2_9AGAM|nr:unnamed protein product [Rhizoctonia solani]
MPLLMHSPIEVSILPAFRYGQYFATLSRSNSINSYPEYAPPPDEIATTTLPSAGSEDATLEEFGGEKLDTELVIQDIASHDPTDSTSHSFTRDPTSSSSVEHL